MLFARTLILIMNTLTFLIRNLHKHWTCSQECVKFLETLSMSREFKEKRRKNAKLLHATEECITARKHTNVFPNQILTVFPKSKPNISKPSMQFFQKPNTGFLSRSKELSFCHKLWFLNTYIFGTKCRKLLIFQTYIIWSNLSNSLKCNRSTTLESRDIGIRKSE